LSLARGVDGLAQNSRRFLRRLAAKDVYWHGAFARALESVLISEKSRLRVSRKREECYGTGVESEFTVPGSSFEFQGAEF